MTMHSPTTRHIVAVCLSPLLAYALYRVFRTIKEIRNRKDDP